MKRVSFERGNSVVIILVAGLVAVAVVGFIGYRRYKSATAPDAVSLQPSVNPGNQTPITSSAPMASQSSTTGATVTTDTQIDADIKALDQKMTKMNTDVGQSQVTPTEPPQN